MSDVAHFLQRVEADIRAALPEVLPLRNTREEKEDQSYVTKGDLLMQEVVLRAASEELPDFQQVSEESPLPEGGSGSSGVVVVDPIDGTENFTSGLPEWGVSICCFQDGVHAGSLLGCPEMDLWMRNGDRIPRHQSRIRGLSSSLSMEDLQRSTVGFEYRILGCCVYNMMNVIRGSYQSFENPKGAKSWDILAGLNLALELGLDVTVEGKKYEGQYLQPAERYRFKIEHK